MMENRHKEAFDALKKLEPEDLRALTDLTTESVDRGMTLQQYKREFQCLLTAIQNRENLKKETLSIAQKAMRG